MKLFTDQETDLWQLLTLSVLYNRKNHTTACQWRIKISFCYPSEQNQDLEICLQNGNNLRVTSNTK